jgi:hypothetical protein
VPDDITAVPSTIGHATDAFTQLARPELNAAEKAASARRTYFAARRATVYSTTSAISPDLGVRAGGDVATGVTPAPGSCTWTQLRRC